jgi:DNA polymerase-3 subunit gamma/tau
MPSQTIPQKTIYNDWYIADRPRSLDQVFGQDAIVKSLKQDLKNDQYSKAYMFMGTFGSGKSTLAKIVAMNIACKNGDPKTHQACGVCPSCRAVLDETYDRDVVYVNGTSMSAEDVRIIVDQFKQTMAFRDRAKVMIVDEIQDLSPEALNSILQVTESPRKGIHFIFAAMDKLKGKLGGALESRCKKWKLKVPKVDDLYEYLFNLVKSHEIHKEFTDQELFNNFISPDGVLRMIAENCEYSYRKAIQLLEQVTMGRLFTKEEAKSALDLELYEDVLKTLIDLANSKITNVVIDTISGPNYDKDLMLISKIIGDAAIIKECGQLYTESEEKWKEQQPRLLSEAPYFDIVRDGVISIIEKRQGYTPRGVWECGMAEIVRKVKIASGLGGINSIPEGVTIEKPKRVRVTK